MSGAADYALHASGGTLELHTVVRRAAVRDDATLRITGAGVPHKFVKMDLDVGSCLLSPEDCRQLANKLFQLAKEIE